MERSIDLSPHWRFLKPYFDHTSFLLGGVPFIEQGLSTSNLPTSDSAGSSIPSPSTTDSGLDSCSKTTSREDLSDLEQCNSSATTLPGTGPGSPEAQVDLSVILICVLGPKILYLIDQYFYSLFMLELG